MPLGRAGRIRCAACRRSSARLRSSCSVSASGWCCVTCATRGGHARRCAGNPRRAAGTRRRPPATFVMRSRAAASSAITASNDAGLLAHALQRGLRFGGRARPSGRRTPEAEAARDSARRAHLACSTTTSTGPLGEPASTASRSATFSRVYALLPIASAGPDRRTRTLERLAGVVDRVGEIVAPGRHAGDPSRCRAGRSRRGGSPRHRSRPRPRNARLSGFSSCSALPDQLARRGTERRGGERDGKAGSGARRDRRHGHVLRVPLGSVVTCVPRRRCTPRTHGALRVRPAGDRGRTRARRR